MGKFNLKKSFNFDMSSGHFEKLDKFKNLDDIKPLIRFLVVFLSPVVLFALMFYLFILPLYDSIEGVSLNIKHEQIKLEKNKRLAVDIEKKRIEYKGLQDKLLIALNMLPKRSQIPDLLDNVSRAGLTTGLKFSKFQPTKEVRKSIHTEVPSNFVAQATFKQLMQFLDNTGELPRIVDVKGLEITKKSNLSNLLTIKGSILTYRFSDKVNKKQKRRSRHRKH